MFTLLIFEYVLIPRGVPVIESYAYITASVDSPEVSVSLYLEINGYVHSVDISRPHYTESGAIDSCKNITDLRIL